jgi:hypothetical protein
LDNARAFGLDVVSSLLHAVDQARDKPHVAYVAAHILGCLCRSLPSIREQVYAYKKVVQDASHVGECSHEALARASSRLLDTLSSQRVPMCE